jgi:hypothetical protein
MEPMKYVLTPTQLMPGVVAQLQNVPATECYFEGKLLRHPADIFTLVFRNLLESGIALCQDHRQALETLGNAPDAHAVDKRLLRSLRAFHTSLGDYVNACRSVIYYVRTKDEAKKGNQDFKAAANPYYDHVTKVDNFIKHQQRALRTVYASWPQGQIIGYQVEGMITVGAVGAELLIHRYAGTAFSLNRAMKYHACHIYLMASALQTVLKLPKPDEQQPAQNHEPLAATFLDLVAEIPMLFFPDELGENVPLVKKRSDGVFLLECPSSVKPNNCKTHEMNVNFRVEVSVHALAVEMPYLGTERPWERKIQRK